MNKVQPSHSSSTALALFDFDGTITTHETMPKFLLRSVSRYRLVIGWLLLAPLIFGYQLGLVSGTLIRRALVRFGYQGVPASVVDAFGQDFAQNYLPTTLRTEAMQRIAWHKAQGHRVVVVSGGLDAYLRPWCDAQGLELLCSSLQSRGGVLTGHYDGQQCVLAEKARRVQQSYDLASFAEIYAYGDTPEDQYLLGIASQKYYQWQPMDAATNS